MFWKFSVISIMILFLWTACALKHKEEVSTPLQRSVVNVEKDKNALESRVKEYWEDLVAGKILNAFKFIEPSAQNDPNRFRFLSGMRKFEFVGYEIKKIDIMGNKASVVVRRRFKIVPGLVPLNVGLLSQTMRDKWVKINGKWYLAHEMPKSPFPMPSGRQNEKGALKEKQLPKFGVGRAK